LDSISENVLKLGYQLESKYDVINKKYGKNMCIISNAMFKDNEKLYVVID
jgi:hypothetical protein